MNEGDYYVLEGHEAVHADLMTWARWFEDSDGRRVASDEVGEARVSTVCLGLDHNWYGGPPHIFETMVFGGDHDQYTLRYSTWDEAQAGHDAVVAALRDGTDLP